MSITVLLADDKDVVRHSIRVLLGSDPEIRVVGETTDFRQTLQLASDLKPQVILMDLHMPDDVSVGAEEIKSVVYTLGARLIAMSFWNDENTRLVAERFGAVTLLDKMRLATELIPAIKSASRPPPQAQQTTAPPPPTD